MGKLCPSAPCGPDAMLIGRLAEDGVVHLTDRPLQMTPDLVGAIGGPEAANKSLRFASPCRGAACGHWDGKCGVPGMARHLAKPQPKAAVALPDCPIRLRCRWYAQDGSTACQLCINIVREGAVVI